MASLEKCTEGGQDKQQQEEELLQAQYIELFWANIILDSIWIVEIVRQRMRKRTMLGMRKIKNKSKLKFFHQLLQFYSPYQIKNLNMHRFSYDIIIFQFLPHLNKQNLKSLPLSLSTPLDLDLAVMVNGKPGIRWAGLSQWSWSSFMRKQLFKKKSKDN